ncbi:NUDIX hydrolase [Pelagibius marinus]|uniref:NUDIX hydrolase n=1 Tax=Pelagibius marinus TaxID=2762760 RepID=UPI001873232A|nr:NUDIX hydrolase [Pelagibius marinus]
MESEAFMGAKIALVCGADLVAYKRDDIPAIPWPGLWDLPGGGREGAETPADCALREVEEEFGLALAPGRVHWCRRYPAMLDPQRSSYFLAAEIAAAEVAAIRFGAEGQYWRMMPIEDFLVLPDAISQLQRRLSDYLSGRR